MSKDSGRERSFAKRFSSTEESVESSEREGRITEEIRKQFPETLEEALKFYNVKVKSV